MLLNASLLNTALLDGDAAGSLARVGGGRYVPDSELRTLTTGAVLTVIARVMISDAAGVVRTYHNRSGIDWIHSIEYGGDIDAPIGTATVRLWREKGSKSIAPLRSLSSYNIDGPSIDAGRRITIQTATIAASATPYDTDLKTVFDGFIDNIDWSQNPVVLECRDLGAQFADTWITFKGSLNAPGSYETIQATMQNLVNLLFGDVYVEVYTPILPDPAVMVAEFPFDIEPAIDAMVRLAQTNGWDIRYRWSDADQMFRLTFKDPGRTKTTPDFTLSSGMYILVPALKIDRIPIRNDITVEYGPADAREQVHATSSDSRARYGRRSMVVQEASDSPINTADSAQLMADLIAFDLSEPKAEMTLEMPYFWPVELHNLIRITPNGVHSDTPLDLSVVGYKHVLTKEQSRTTLTLRGSPAGSYWQWLSRRPVAGGGTGTDTGGGTGGSTTPAGFSNVRQTPDYGADTIRFDWVWGGASATFEVWVSTNSGGYISVADTGTTATYTYSVFQDIEPFLPPPSPPQEPITIAFYVVAHRTGFPDVKSVVSAVLYADGSEGHTPHPI